MTTTKLKILRDLEVHGYMPNVRGFVQAWFFSPGFKTIFLHRLAMQLSRGGSLGRLTGKLLWRRNIKISSCHLSLNADIGGGLLMPHPVGVVIGDGVRIGNDVTIYQSVTLGAGKGHSEGYPTLGDDVTVYPGTIVAGGVVIGQGATIGANSFVNRDVGPGATFARSPVVTFPP